MLVSLSLSGIGDQVDKTELQAIASKPASNYVFMIDNFDALTKIKEELAIKACEGRYIVL